MKRKANRLLSLQVLHTAMLTGMVLCCIAAAVARMPAKWAMAGPAAKVLQVIVLLLTFGSVKAGFFFFSKRLQSLSPTAPAVAKLAVYRTAAIIKWILLEVPVLLSVFSFMITRNYAFIALAFVLLVLFAFQGPVKAGIVLHLRLTSSEVQELEGMSE